MDESSPHQAQREPLIGGYTGRLLTTVSLGSMTVLAGQMVLSPLLPTIIAELDLTPSRAGFALTIMWATAALFQYPGGRISDRLSRKTVLMAALVILVSGFSFLMAGTTYPMFIGGAGIIGMGVGLYMTAGFALVSDLFETRRGAALGVTTASGNIGSALSGGLAIAVLSLATWRAAFLPIIALLVLVFVLLGLYSSEPIVVGRPSLAIRETAARVLHHREVLWLLLALALIMFVWQGSASFLPTYLQAERSFSAALASQIFGAFFVVGAIANPIAGSLGDRSGYLTVALAAAGLAVVGLLVLLAGTAKIVVMAGILVFAVGLSAMFPMLFTAVMDHVPESSVGTDFGAIRTVYITFASLGSTYVGVVSEQINYATAFSGFIICLLLCVGIILNLSRRSTPT